MYKKSLILVSVIIFALCVFSTFVFATENVKNSISNVTDTVVDGAARLGNDVRSGVGSVENGIENTLNMDNNADEANRTNDNNNAGIIGDVDNYATTRTTADATTPTDNTSTLWIWLIVGIAAFVIIGLVWYYGAQNNTHHSK